MTPRFSSKVVVHGHRLVTLPLIANETLEWLSSLPIVVQNQCGGDSGALRRAAPPSPPRDALSRDKWALHKCKERSQLVLTVKADTHLTGTQMATEQTRWTRRPRNRQGGQGTAEVDEEATEQTKRPRNRRRGLGTDEVAKEQTRWTRRPRNRQGGRGGLGTDEEA